MVYIQGWVTLRGSSISFESTTTAKSSESRPQWPQNETQCLLTEWIYWGELAVKFQGRSFRKPNLCCLHLERLGVGTRKFWRLTPCSCNARLCDHCSQVNFNMTRSVIRRLGHGKWCLKKRSDFVGNRIMWINLLCQPNAGVRSFSWSKDPWCEFVWPLRKVPVGCFF